MRWSDVTAPPTDRKLREFAVVAAFILAILAAWRLLVPSGWLLAASYGIGAVIVGLIGLARPRWLAPVFSLWMIIAFPIAWLVSHLVLAVIYYGLITPLGVTFRLFGRDAQDRSWPGRQDTYWRDKPAADNSERYLKQF
jgi:hypothetical protein